MNLVTGATGHIGNVLVRALLQQGEKVRALILPGEDTACLNGLDLERVQGDVLQIESLHGAFQGVDIVYHLAGLISILPGRNRRVEQVNVSGTQNVLQAALQADIHRLVYTSSIHAIRRVPHGNWIDEGVPFDPVNAISAYDRSKAIATLAVQAAFSQGLDVVIACPTGVIGPYDYRISEIGQLILDCLELKPQLYVDGAYDFVDVRDVALGLIQTGRRGTSGRSYILSGEQISVKRLLEMVSDLTGGGFVMRRIPVGLARFISVFAPLYYRMLRIKPRFTPYSLETLWSNSAISHARASAELDYSPRSLRESLADTVAWLDAYRQNRSPVQYFA